MCLEREVMQPPGGGDLKVGDNLCPSDLGSSSSVMESGILEEDEEDADEEEDVSGASGEIPYVDMPGPSLEEELEEDAIAAAK